MRRPRLLVKAADAATLNAYLVGQDIRVTEVGPHRRDLEHVVLEAASHVPDTVERPDREPVPGAVP